MKRTAISRKSKSVFTKIQDKLWELCRQITFLRYGRDCYTCEAKGLSGWNCQCGHMIAKAALGAFLKYDLRVLRPQCDTCNQFRGGMGAVFIDKMRRIEGNEYVDQILKDRQITVKATEHYLKLIIDYKNILQGLKQEDATKTS